MRILSIFLTLMALIAGLLSCAQPIAEDPVQYNLTVSSSGGGSVITPGEDTFVYEDGVVVDLVATADDGYHFVEWTGEVDMVASVTAAATTITMKGDYSITASFAEIPPARYSLTVSSTTGGSVIAPGEGTFTYDADTVVDLVAEADTGYRFVNWTGDVDTIVDVEAASTTITLEGDYSITASFLVIPIAKYNLTISSTVGGNVTTPGEGTFTYDAGTVVNAVAVRASGYRFLHWAGDVEGIADVDTASATFTMNRDRSIVASFIETIEIWNWYDLNAVRDDLGGDYLLMSDLDSTTAGYGGLANSSANGGRGWKPIGDAYHDPNLGLVGQPFVGAFDGQGYEIRDMFVYRPEGWVGLFGYVGNEGVIRNVAVAESHVTGGHVVGGLVGWNRGTVSNCYSTGRASGASVVGGLIGQNVEGMVSNSYSTCTVTSSYGGAIGGLIGRNWGVVSDCHFGGMVTCEWCGASDVLALDVGGMIGFNGGTVINSYYNYNEVLISGSSIITVGALFAEDFQEWLANGKLLDVDQRLSQKDGWYLINDLDDFKELLAFGQNSALRFKLTADLDLANEPGFYVPHIGGEFDGDGHTISNLSFSFNFVSCVGLFGSLAPGGRITGLGAKNVNVTGSQSVGGLLGHTSGGTVSNSYSTGSVIGNLNVGGLVGWNGGGTIGRSYSTASVTGVGLVYVGGLVGRNSGTLHDSYSTGGVIGGAYVGGLAGLNDGTVSNSYSRGTVSGTEMVGGLVGSEISPAPPRAGTSSQSFWDRQASGITASGGGMGMTTPQMKTVATFSAAGWNIVTVPNLGTRNTSYIWNIVDGQTYPFLSWQPVS